MNKKIVVVLLILSVAGAIVASLSLHQHLKMIETGVVGESFCTINETINCDAINSSPYSQWKGLPVAGLGLIFYIFIILHSLIALGLKPSKKSGLTFAFFISSAGLVIALGMAYISFFKIKALCLLCVAMYGINLALFLLFPLACGLSYGDIPFMVQHYVRACFRRPNVLGFKPRLRLQILFFLVVFGGGAFLLNQATTQAHAAYAESKKKNPKGTDAQEFSIDDLIDMHYAQPAIPLDPGNRPMWGNPDAKIKIIEFSDFQCPYCRVAAETLKPNLMNYKNDVALYYAFYPLDQSCNPKIQNKFHDKACMAAQAAICAGKKGKFWEMHDGIFSNQPALSTETVDKIATSLGLDLAWLHACMVSAETKQVILDDVAAGGKVHVEGTPSVYVNGRKLSGWNRKDFLQALIEEEMYRTN